MFCSRFWARSRVNRCLSERFLGRCGKSLLKSTHWSQTISAPTVTRIHTVQGTGHHSEKVGTFMPNSKGHQSLNSRALTDKKRTLSRGLSESFLSLAVTRGLLMCRANHCCSSWYTPGQASKFTNRHTKWQTNKCCRKLVNVVILQNSSIAVLFAYISRRCPQLNFNIHPTPPFSSHSSPAPRLRGQTRTQTSGHPILLFSCSSIPLDLRCRPRHN